jgi:SpoVK/Ycf46/Vps4 family AAA+-type ATPase
MLLYGKPGTGKTQIARTLANESGVGFIAAGPSDLKAGWVGQSAPKVHELFERARREAPCILFIDEVDAAFPKRGGAQTDQFNTEIVNQALTELDGVKKNDRFVFLLAATNRPELVDDAILSRFPDRMEVPYPDPQQRKQILQVLIAKKPVDFDIEKVATELAGITDNFCGRDLWSLVENASQAAMARAFDSDAAQTEEVRIFISREDLISQVPSSQAAPDGLPAGA